MAPEHPKLSPVAIVGVGCLFPKAGGARDYWANVKGGVDAITEVPPSHWRREDYFDKDPKKPDMTYAFRGGFLDPVEFDPAEFGITPSALEATDSAQLLGLVAAGMALQDAGYGPKREFDRSRVSVILGVTGTLELVVPLGARLGHPIWRKALKDSSIEEGLAEEVIERIKAGYVPWQEASFPGLLGNVVAGRIANRFNLGGTNCVVDAACASSLSAAHLATMELATGKADMVVTGGADCFNDIFMFMCFSKTPALSPTGDLRPFDAQADGTILGEGLGMLVLKRLEDAERDGDRVYAVIKGVGSSSDGRGKAIYAPSAEGQTKALKNAYEAAGVSPAEVELVEAHGTGTSVGDAAELSALTEVYRAARPEGTWCALGSVKSMIGHTKAAAGSAGVIKAALSLYHKVLPPTIKVRKPQPLLEGGQSPFYLSADKRPWLSSGHPRRAAVSALGFGGSNFHLVLEEHRPKKEAIDWDGSVQLIAFSGPDASALDTALRAWTSPMSWDEIRVNAMRSRAAFRAQDSARLLLVAEKGKTDLPKLASAASQALQSRGAERSWSLPEGAWFGRGEAGKLAFLFPGQGSQYVGMGRDAACQFPQAHAACAAAGDVARLIFPQPALSAEAKARQEETLRQTQNAQPALGAAAMAYLAVLDHFGVTPDLAAGHSYGELAALYCAGVFDVKTLLSLSQQRGSAMAEGDAGRGAMLAVSAPSEAIAQLLSEEKLDLVLANKNAPQQNVLSGRKEEISRAAEACARRGLKCAALPVSAAFHSPLVAGAEARFREALERAPLSRARLPVYANKTAAPYPESAEEMRSLLSSQLASPVEFSAMVLRMHDDGARVFLEVGAGGRLTGLVSSILSGKPLSAAAVDASSGRKPGALDLARALAVVAASGRDVRLALWEGGEEGVRDVLERPKRKMAVKLTGANYRSAPAKAPASRKEPVQTRPEPGTASRSQAPSGIDDAIRASQDAIAAFQRMQEQTAQLHAKFLEGQEAALRQFQALIAGQPLPQPAALPALERVAAAPERPSPPTTSDPILPALLAIVSEKTGYPAETINIEMDLESDLGIDSIKRVEIMSAVSEKLPDAPKVKPEHLGTLRTLKQIVEFLSQGNPQQAGETRRPDLSVTGALNCTSPRGAAGDDLLPVLLSIVSEKTGYPVETLNVDMDLESDLGIDSIKRVEIMSAVSEKLPDSPKVKPEHLGTLRTLKQILEFLGSSRPSAASSELILSTVLAVVSEKTGYPGETLNIDMDLESDLGIDSIKRVEIMSAVSEKLPDAPKVKPEHLGTLRTLKQIVAFLSERKEGAPETFVNKSPQRTNVDKPAPSVISRLVPRIVDAPPRSDTKLSFSGPVLVIGTGTALEASLVSALLARGVKAKACGLEIPAQDAAGLVIVAPAKPEWDEASEDFARRAILLAQRFVGKVSLFATVSRLDGAFGFEGKGFNPVYGSLAGLAKTAALEWPQARVRAIDVAPDFTDVEALVAELLSEGPVELGLSRDRRVAIETVEAPAEAGEFPLQDGDVVLVTGGARGVTAECAAALALRARLTLILWGRTAWPVEEAAEISGCRTEAELKRAFAAQGLAPKEIGRRCKETLAAREIGENLRRLEALGATAVYRAVDVTDASAVDAALEEGRTLGPICALVHGAGVLADKKLSEKTRAQFDAVWKTKVSSLRHLLSRLDLSQLKAVALFSSTTARQGRVGQGDYAMANEALNKAAQALSRRLPHARVRAIGWGPWDGGMVDASLAKVFSAEGVALIGREAGGRFLVSELSAGGPAEVVALAVSGENLSEVFSRKISLASWPVLGDHRLAGKPVLPLALAAEMLGHAALHSSPGLMFHGFDELRVLKGVRLEGESVTVKVCAGRARKTGGAWVAPVEIRDEAGRPLVSAQVVLGASRPQAPAACAPIEGEAAAAERAYSETLFHGPMMRFLAGSLTLSEAGVDARCSAAPRPADWVREPWRDRWLLEPAALDSAFQAMIVWTRRFLGAPSLPTALSRLRQFAQFPAEGCRVLCRVVRKSAAKAVADVELQDAAGLLIARLEGYECAADAALSSAFGKTPEVLVP